MAKPGKDLQLFCDIPLPFRRQNTLYHTRVDALSLPRQLYLQRQAYQLNGRFEETSENPALTLSFQEFQSPLGRLQLAGLYLKRVVLESDTPQTGFSVILDAPGPENPVPLGAYSRQIVLIQRAGYTNVAVGVINQPISVTETKAPLLVAGGRLNNSVRTPDNGGASLSYQLVNEAGYVFAPNPAKRDGSPVSCDVPGRPPNRRRAICLSLRRRLRVFLGNTFQC